MKKIILLLVCTIILGTYNVALAKLDDSRQTIAKQYGDFRLVIDSDNQLWTKDDWDTKGYKRAKAVSYMHSFSRQGLRIQMEVTYDNASPDSLVKAQRFTPDTAIKIKDFKLYFPEVYALITSPKAQPFATYALLTRNFQEDVSPVTMGVLIKAPPAATKNSGYTLVAFNVQDEGRLLKDIKFLDENAYIREFTIESVFKSTASEALEFTDEWKPIKNYF